MDPGNRITTRAPTRVPVVHGPAVQVKVEAEVEGAVEVEVEVGMGVEVEAAAEAAAAAAAADSPSPSTVAPRNSGSSRVSGLSWASE